MVGESGTGKSSLVRAGAVPTIQEGALGSWPKDYRSVVLTPGPEPLATLSAALSEVIGAPLAEHPERIAQQLAAHVDAHGVGVLIVIDQLEELVTLHAPSATERRAAVVGLLAHLADAPTPGVRAIVTARRDLLDALLAIDPLFARALSRGMQFLAPLSDGTWEDVVDQALEAYGYRFEDPALREELLGDLQGMDSAMPLVQFALTRLWAERDPVAKTITRASYRAIGGVRGALEQHADATAAHLAGDAATLRGALLAMTTPRGTRAHTQLDTLVARLGEPVRETVLALARARLVTQEETGLTIVHESLLREWGQLRGWIEEARANRLLAEELERDASRWERTRDAAELWRKRRLSAALELEKHGQVPLSDAARAFVRAGLREERRGRLAALALGLVLVAGVVGAAVWNAKQSRARANEAANDAAAVARANEGLRASEAVARKNEQVATESAKKAAESERTAVELQKKFDGELKDLKDKLDAVKKLIESGKRDEAAKLFKELTGAKSEPANKPLAPLLGGETKIEREVPF